MLAVSRLGYSRFVIEYHCVTSKLYKSTTVSEPPHLFFAEAPTNVRITDITKTSISIAWQKPNYDGGSKISGYLIEKKESEKDRWTKANLTNVSETHYTVTGLTQDETYEFRVMAKNAVGSVSNPSIIAGPATCVDTYGGLCSKHDKSRNLTFN